MIKRSSLRRICVATLALFILLIIYFFPTTNNISESLNYIEKDEMPIFLVDQMDYIARTTIVKDSNTLENQILEIVKYTNNVEIIIYGTLELMIMNHCIISMNDKCPNCKQDKYYLKNKQNELFPIITKNCT